MGLKMRNKNIQNRNRIRIRKTVRNRAKSNKMNRKPQL